MINELNTNPILAWYIVGGLLAIALLLTFIMQYLFSKDPLGKLKKKEK